MTVHLIGKYETTKYTIEFKKEGEKIFADYYPGWQFQATYPVERRSLEVLSVTDVSSSLYDLVSRFLTQKYIPSISQETLVWAPPAPVHDTVVKVAQHLFLAEQSMKEKKYPEAITSLLDAQGLAAQVLDPFGEANFLEKLNREWVQELIDRTHDPRIELLLLKKDSVRRAFETFLQQLALSSPQRKKPNCFICFSIEIDIVHWLEHTFVPDLDLMGIAPLFCFRQLGPGKELNRFQRLVRVSDLVVLICTPDLRKKCIERAADPKGVAEEIRFAIERNNDPKKQDTTYPLYLKGNREELCPSPDFESILGPDLTLFGNNNSSDHFYSYYSEVFEVFGNMRNIPRATSRDAKRAFLREIQKILNDKTIDRTAVAQWLIERNEHKKSIAASAAQVVEEAMGMPVNKSDRIRLNAPHPNFVGRNELLGKLEEEFLLKTWNPANPTKIRLLYGPAGIGKTEISVTFGNNFLASFCLIWVFRANSPHLFEKDYRKLAARLNLDIENDNFSAIRRKVHKALERGIDNSSQPWLLIFDSAEETIVIPQRGGCVLVTTQHREIWPDPKAFLPVSPFSITEVDLLFKQLEYTTSETNTQPLIEALEGFPVLIEQVGHFLAKTHCSIPEYLHDIHSDKGVLFNEEGQRYPKALGKVFQRALELLKSKDTHAHAFIHFCAFLNPVQISSQLLDFWAFKNNLTPLQKKNVIGALGDALLMRYSTSTQAFSLHRLVQVAIQEMDEQGKQYDLTVQLLATWAQQFDWHEVKTWRVGEECTHHLEKVKSHPRWEGPTQKSKSDLLLTSGLWFSRVKAEPNEGIDLMQQSLNYAKRIYGEESREVALHLSEIGVCHLFMKEPTKAHSYFSNALEMRIRVLGEIDAETAASYNNLTLTRQETVEKQLAHLKKALEIWQKVHGGNSHPDVSIAYHNLADFFKRSGRNDEALSNVSIAIEILKNYYKEPYPSLARSYWLLGGIQEIVAPETALSSYRESAKIFEAVYGKTHVLVAEAYISVGRSYQKLKQFENALQQFEIALSIFNDLKGKDSSKAAEVCMYQGDVFQEMGALDKSLAVRKKGLAMWQAIYVEDHYYLGWGHLEVGAALDELKRYDEALIHFQEALRLMKITKGPNSSQTIAAYNNLAAVLENLNRNAEALYNFKTAFITAAQTQNLDTRKYFKHMVESLMKQTDPQLFLSTKTELLAFCMTLPDEGIQFSAQLQPISISLFSSGVFERSRREIQQISDSFVNISHEECGAAAAGPKEFCSVQ